MEQNAKLYLTDLIDVATLQKIQDSFANMTGMAALTTDIDGVAVTKGSNFSDFCMHHTRKSALGCKRCESCDKYGAEMALKEGKSVTYYCHAGLMDFAAPIMANGQMIGCFIGGQVLTDKKSDEEVIEVANELGINPNEYIEAAHKVNIVDKDSIDKSAEFLYKTASVLSDIAYGRYMQIQANKDIEHIAQLKSDFLANMSHEIRTPMNAVIGMAEMALREDLGENARDYIQQIKASGNALLAIINDILDFSKIESGKMSIIKDNYEIVSVINDISNIIDTRMVEKDVEFIVDMDPKLPSVLYGDSLRIKQILLNLVTNAVKFTNHGTVKLSITGQRLGKSNLVLLISVEDTGIGIRDEDREILFDSFQQLDNKKNRNIEGTGLGLAISKKLLTLMGGDIFVESEYGRGSTFSITIPQQIIDEKPSVELSKMDNKIVVIYLDNEYIREQLIRDCESLGIDYVSVSNYKEIDNISETLRKYIIIEADNYNEQIADYYSGKDNIVVGLLQSYNDNVIPGGVIGIRRPLYALNLAHFINNEESIHLVREKEYKIDFKAPKASILLVDDNDINLKVAEGLLKPLEMKIDSVNSGKKAIDILQSKSYDIIFMDHVMPELDGVETVHIIREKYGHLDKVPIIAFTANAMDGTRELLIKEGMNDYIAKPLEIHRLFRIVKKWLPSEKLMPLDEMIDTSEALGQFDKEVVNDIVFDDKIDGSVYEDDFFESMSDSWFGDEVYLDAASAIEMLGSREFYASILMTYAGEIDDRSKALDEFFINKDWTGYGMNIHGLKGTSRQIGATRMAKQAEELEAACREVDEQYIFTHHNVAMALYKLHKKAIDKYLRNL